MKTTKITPLGKIVIFMVVAAMVVGGVYFTGGFNFLSKSKSKSTEAAAGPTNNVPTTQSKAEENVINISADQWIGSKNLIDANGGLTTKASTIFNKLGLKVNVNIIDDATQSSNSLISGKLDAAVYTINRYAFLYPKFKDAGVQTVMPIIDNVSSGGDGIIAKTGINRIEDLVGKKIAVPRFSESQTLLYWLMDKSSLTEDQKKQIVKDMVMFDDPGDCAKAAFSGQVDAACTWQPFLSQAEDTTGMHILFSTKSAKNIIMDGIVFRKDYVDKHPETVKKFIQGLIEAGDVYDKQFDAIKNAMPLFSTETDDSIKGMLGDATLVNYPANKELMNGTAQTLFAQMSDIWKKIGEKAYTEDASKAIDGQYVNAIADKFQDQTQSSTKQTFTPEQRTEAQKQDNNQALLTKRLTINFETGSAAISPESYVSLNDFVNVAKILNGTIVQIEGNTDNVGDAASNKALSEKRARSVAMYLQSQGVDPTRFIIVGNGPDKAIADNGTDAGKAANRRTDVYFKAVK